MSKKRRKIQSDSKVISPVLMEHICRLELKSVEEYRQWCSARNYSPGLCKSIAQLKREYHFFISEKAAQILKASKKNKNLKNFVQAVYQKKISRQDINGRTQEMLYHAFKDATQPRVLLRTLMYLEDQSNILKDPDLLAGTIALASNYPSWIRPLEEWKPVTHNRERQFSSLARHLLAQYDVPVFMDIAFTRRNRVHQEWFIHIGSGNNIRTAKKLPVSLTKRMAHHFMSAPSGYSIEEALRWGQVHGLGGDKRLMKALRETRLVNEFRDNNFWVTVFEFFIRHPMLDTIHINPIIDYIWNQKYENRMVFVARGVAENQGPQQPNFSMKGRTPETLLRQVENWHRQLGRESRSGNFQWVHSPIKDFQWVEGTIKNKNMKTWRIRELLNSKELIAEGRAMRHCVASYAHSCKSGRSSIWSMTMEDYDGINKLLTIEVGNREVISQVRGLYNRRPTEKEKSIIRRWAEKEKLELASYV